MDDTEKSVQIPEFIQATIDEIKEFIKDPTNVKLYMFIGNDAISLKPSGSNSSFTT